jgi:transcriptional regulator with XRE-family HTH domain
MINIELIEKERERRGMTRYRMSKELGMSAQAYYDILRKKSTRITTLDKIATILGLKSKDLLI